MDGPDGDDGGDGDECADGDEGTVKVGPTLLATSMMLFVTSWSISFIEAGDICVLLVASTKGFLMPLLGVSE
jgi:hypothetical protein